ncbi:MAG: N-acetylglucosamine-6-phosphate deacetylase [Dehalococcoidia bacterium]
MGTLLIQGGDVYTPFEAIEDGAVLARDGVIEQVGRRADVATAGADVTVDVGGRIICPGFIDLQVNGGGGALLTEQGDVNAIERMTRAHARFGTTAMLPTVVTTAEAQIARALAAVGEAVGRKPVGARVLGAHLEGPFISVKRKGAHAERFIVPPDRELSRRFIEASAGSLRLITLAPELPGALDLIAAACAASVIVSIGHTDATYEEARAGIAAGATVATHVFNAMRGLHHREPQALGALLQDERVVTTVIADAVHVHPAVLRLVARAKGAQAAALVTDAMSPVGTDVASFNIASGEVAVRDGACYLPNGTLAGSALTMDRAVHNMHRLAGVPLRESIEMATATPARVLGMQAEIGVLTPSAHADIVVCDRDLNIWRVFVGGEEAIAAN